MMNYQTIASHNEKLVWITATKPFNTKLAEICKKNRWQPIVEPLQSVVNFTPHPDDDKNLDAVIFTSNHAIPYLLSMNLSKNTLLGCIGEKALKILQHHNFNNIINITPNFTINNAESIANLMLQSCTLQQRILYLSGQQLRFNIADFLSTHGYNAQRKIAYKLQEVQVISLKLLNIIKNNQLFGVYFSSVGVLNIFIKILEKYQIHPQNIVAICLSEAIAESCQYLPIKWSDIMVF